MPLRALLIDDDERLASLVTDHLRGEGVVVTHAGDGAKGLAALDAGTFDVVLLDVMMPGLDGMEVLRRLRSRHKVPVIMLTARGDEADRVRGLELGADDYVPKPFGPRELHARIRAVLRRASPDALAETLAIGDLEIDVPARVAKRGGRELPLTGIELDILAALARRAGRVVPRDSLLSEAGRGDVVVGERTIDVHISHLRQKLGDDPKAPTLIKTVRGIGYVLAKDPA